MQEGSNALRYAGRWLSGLAMLCVGGLSLPPATAGPRILTDVIDRAPAARKFTSASGRYFLTVAAIDGWKTPRTMATLAASGKRLWRITLPHEGGPRAVLVSDRGAVLFVDEWINVIPRHALMVVTATGKVVGDHPGEAVLTMLQVPRRTIGDAARKGPWRSSDAVLSADGRHASLRAGGRTVTVSMDDGMLRVTDAR